MNNIYNIPSDMTVGRLYKRTYNEKKFRSFDHYFEKIFKSEHKLKYGIFKRDGKFYRAKYRKIDMTIREEDIDSQTISTIHRIVQFRWKFIPLSE